MACMNPPTLNMYNTTQGLHVLLQAADDASCGLFINGILMAYFFIVCMGTYFAQRRLTGGRADFPASFAVAGLVTAVTAVIMTLIPNLISTWTVVVAIVVAIIGFIFVSITREN